MSLNRTYEVNERFNLQLIRLRIKKIKTNIKSVGLRLLKCFHGDRDKSQLFGPQLVHKRRYKF